jgi:hypothetical protein
MKRASALALITLAVAACQVSNKTSDTKAQSLTDCGYYDGNIVDKHGTAVGTAEVTDDGTNLHILLTTSGDYRLWTIRAYAGVAPIPVNSDGDTNVGWFPYSVTLGDGSHDQAGYPSTYEMLIPLADLGVTPDTCGLINVAVYARLKSWDSSGLFLGAPRTWVDGPITFGDINYPHHDGTGFTYEFCCDDEEEEGCTLTQGYWKTHNADAKQPKKRVDWPGPSEDDLLCGMELLDILNTQPLGDGWYILAHQYIAASLNVSAGASSPADVAQALADAGDLLINTCNGMTAEERAEAIALSETLDDYNNGEIGPGHCDDNDGGNDTSAPVID